MSKTTYEYEIDDENEVTLVTRKPLGFVADVNTHELPDSLIERHEEELAAYNDAQRAAFGVVDAARTAFEGSRGSFNGRPAR